MFTEDCGGTSARIRGLTGGKLIGVVLTVGDGLGRPLLLLLSLVISFKLTAATAAESFDMNESRD